MSISLNSFLAQRFCDDLLSDEQRNLKKNEEHRAFIKTLEMELRKEDAKFQKKEEIVIESPLISMDSGLASSPDSRSQLFSPMSPSIIGQTDDELGNDDELSEDEFFNDENEDDNVPASGLAGEFFSFANSEKDINLLLKAAVSSGMMIPDTTIKISKHAAHRMLPKKLTDQLKRKYPRLRIDKEGGRDIALKTVSDLVKKAENNDKSIEIREYVEDGIIKRKISGDGVMAVFNKTNKTLVTVCWRKALNDSPVSQRGSPLPEFSCERKTGLIQPLATTILQKK